MEMGERHGGAFGRIDAGRGGNREIGTLCRLCNRVGKNYLPYTRSTKLSTTFFSPAFSNAIVSLLPSIFTTLP
jgi:hypothetical protein